MEHEITVVTYEDDNLQSTNEGITVDLPIRTVTRLAQSYLDDISGGDVYEAEAALKELSEFVHRVLNQKTKPGDADDWHNFAVDIARKDLFGLACDILECGLTIFPKNIDLLADYLEYGTSCGRIDSCKNYYKTLSKIPKIRWSWRGYSFSVNYLKYLWERSDSEKELKRLQDDMFDLAKLFRKNLPYDEECYRCEADIYRLLNEKKEEEETLRLALTELNIAPKCALRLADLLFERGDYQGAMEQIQRGLRDATRTQRSISEGYLYYLSGLSKMALAQQSEDDLSRESVLSIYSDFDISLRQERRAAYVNTMKAKAIVLMSKSGTAIPDEYEKLLEIVQD